MKNQYVGDVNDYRKYGLIRALAGDNAFQVGVFWMLTADDSHNDGKFLDYLGQPKQWRHHDPFLFDSLHGIIHKYRQRAVSLVQELSILPGAVFMASPLHDDAESRGKIVLATFESFSGRELVFFDPDNGLEIQSKPIGHKNSNKYLYFSEVAQAFARGHSSVIYQHFPHIKRDLYINDRAKQLQKATGASTIFSFSTSFVCFFVVPQEEHVALFKERLEVVRSRWCKQFVLRTHHMS